MRAVLQRVTRASVSVDGEVVGRIGAGIVALVGATHTDTSDDAQVIARKIAELRILAGERSVSEVASEGGQVGVLVISQFTLYGSTRKGRRPSWSAAAPGPVAEPLIDAVVADLAARGVPVATGRFGAMMHLELVNDGPVTLLVETDQTNV